MKHSDTLAAIAPALVAALGKIEGAAKTKANPGFKGTKYADLETVINASRDILTEHGLTIIQLPGACAAGILNLETILMHTSGEWISGEMGIALGKTDPQGVGSALTYARRYAQMAALNMPAVDDDGERAMGREHPTPSAEEMAVNLLRGCGSPEMFKDAWLKNKDGWQKVLGRDAYARLVSEMKTLAAKFPKDDAAAPPPLTDDFGDSANNIPF